MHRFRSLISAVFLLLMASVVGSLQAQDGLVDAFARLHTVSVPRSEILGTALATADFNNDSHPDGAVLFRDNSTFRIEVHFRFGQVTRIEFASPIPTLAISACDVNHDGNVDLVVEEPFSHQRLFVWLNDGSGFFHSANDVDHSFQVENFAFMLAAQTRDPLGPAIPIAGKLRVRVDLSGSIRIPAHEDRIRPVPQAIRRLAGFASAHNLLRGPPNVLV